MKNQIKCMKPVLLLVGAAMVFSLTSRAAIIRVPIDQPTVQSGINAAAQHDTVLVDPGVYIENIDFNGKNILVASRFLLTGDTNFIVHTVLSGENPTDPNHGSVVSIHSGEDESAVLKGFTIQKGTGTYTNPYNDSYYVYVGGGIYCAGASPRFENLVIKTNSVTDWGGGVFIMNSTSAFEQITLSHNSAYTGGGMLNWCDANTTFDGLVVYSNTANHGSGIEIVESNPVIVRTVIANNMSMIGSGLYIADSSPLIVNAFIQDNHAELYGGGIILWNFGGEDKCPTFINAVISGNSAEEGAGIYYQDYVKTQLVNVTIVNNSASVQGGGIYCLSSSLTNTILWNNTPDNIHYTSVPDSVKMEYSLIPGGWSGVGNIGDDPLLAGSNNFRLTENSPCINTGTPDTSALHLPLTDIDGKMRIVSGRIDMGAFEYDTAIAVGERNMPDIVVYPNPVEAFLRLKGLTSTSAVNIYNMNGELVIKGSLQGEVIYVGQLIPGVYTLEIKAPNGHVLKNFVKK